MRAGRLFIAVIASSAISSPTLAADWYTGAPGYENTPAAGSYISFFDQAPPAPYAKPAPVVVEPYAPAPKFGAAVDVALTADTKDSRFATVIGTIAPFTDLAHSGMRLKIGGTIGTYAYSTTLLGRVTGTQTDGSFMIGYEWVTPKAAFGIYGGADFNNNVLSKWDPNNKSAGQASGVRIGIDFNYRPTTYTMFSGVATFSSAHSAYYSRLKAGYAIAPGTYVGPEAIFMGDDFYKQWRVGAHVTGASFGILQLGASAGLLNDSARGTGLYGILDARVGF